MINIEDDVYNAVATALRAAYAGIFVTGEYVKAPSSFPCVSIAESDNYAVVQTQDSTDMENHATVMYEINAFSNKKSGKKSECKGIIGVVDETMQTMGFTRIALSPVPNMEDATIYRMVARYRAVVSKNKVVYRR